MYITKVTLHKLKWIHTLSHIETLTINALNQIQILIGTNGGGKTAVLNELTPLPALKNNYERGGYKKLTIIHKNDEYVLTSSFETKSGTHSFIKNGEELNVSKLANLQKSLCEDHFGYTTQIDDLIHCRFKITQMSEAERKNLLYALFPATPDFVLEFYKKAKSVIRTTKSLLSRSYQQKKELESQMYSKEEVKLLEDRNKVLTEQQIAICASLTKLEETIHQCKEDLQQLAQGQEVSIEKAKAYKKAIQDVLYRRSISQLSSSDKESIDFQLAACENECKKYESTLEQLQEEYTKYQVDIDSIQDAEEQECITLIEQKKKALEDLKEWTKYKVIRNEDLDKHIEVRDKIYALVEQYQPKAVCSNEIWTHVLDQDYRRTLLNSISESKQELIHIAAQQDTLTASCTSCKEKLARLPDGPKEEAHCCATCSYKGYFDTHKSSLKQEWESYTQKLQDCATKKMSKEEDLTKSTNVYNHLEDKTHYLESVYDLLYGTVFSMSKSELVSILEGDTQHWLSELTKTIQAQRYLQAREELLKEIQEASVTLATLKKTSTSAVAVLKEVIRDKKRNLEQVHSVLLNLRKRQQVLTEYKELESRFVALVKRGEELCQEHTDWHNYHLLQLYISYLEEDIKTHLLNEKKTIENDLFEIRKMLTEQTTLKARYDIDVCKFIGELQTKLKLYEKLEVALSPEEGLPYVEVKRSIEAIIKNINFILSKIWTSRLELQYPSEDKSVGLFNFKARVNDHDPAPINKLSKSQQAVINFGFYIALIYASKNVDYPVFFDECEDGFDVTHKQKYLEWLKSYVDTMYSPEIWLVSHDASTYSGFLYKDVTCLNKDNIIVPEGANIHASITVG